MKPLSPALLIAAASALAGADGKLVPAGERLADRWPDTAALTRDDHAPSDGETTAAFIAHVGYWAHRVAVGRSSWPFPLDANCDQLGRIAADWGILSVGTPDPGVLLLRWSRTEQRFVRASIVLWAANALPTPASNWSYDCLVLEGSAALSRLRVVSGQVNRGLFATVLWARRVRVWCYPSLGDRFISWVDLDARNETTHSQRRAA